MTNASPQRMFCERTVINKRYMACWWRETAFSRRRPLLTQTAACSRTLQLGSDAVAFRLLVVAEHTQFCVASTLFSDAPRTMGQERDSGTICNARTSSCLVIPTLLHLHKQARAQKKTSRIWPKRLSAVCMCVVVSVFFACSLGACTFCFLYLYVRALVPVLVLLNSGCNFGRRVQPAA